MFTKSKTKLILAFLTSLVNFALAAHFDEWKKRTIYQVLTDRFYPAPDYKPTGDTPESACDNLRSYCGGTYKGMVSKIPYIKEMGFDAIWITPPVENTEVFRGTYGYHGYWMTSFEKMNHHFGTAQDLKDFVKACHDEDILVMVDVVGNHAGPIMTNYQQFDGPLNKHEHYHEFCNIDYDDLFQNQWRVERCWFAGSWLISSKKIQKLPKL
jgi:alpha-amylase